MATFDSYAPGTPCWIDLGAADVDAAAAFYTALLGWEVPDGNPEFGGYRSCTLGGKTVAGLMPLMGPVAAWSMYIATADADATAAAFTAAGGTLVSPVMDVGALGRMGVGADSTGCFVGFWQPAEHTGAQVANEAGAWTWSELMTRDLESAKAFYGAVFGWTFDDQTMPGYTVCQIDGKGIGGAMPMPAEMPAEMPNAWGQYFEVADVDASTKQLVELGGSVLMEPTTMEGVGRMAAVRGPGGEAFSLITSPPAP